MLYLLPLALAISAPLLAADPPPAEEPAEAAEPATEAPAPAAAEADAPVVGAPSDEQPAPAEVVEFPAEEPGTLAGLWALLLSWLTELGAVVLGVLGTLLAQWLRARLGVTEDADAVAEVTE